MSRTEAKNFNDCRKILSLSTVINTLVQNVNILCKCKFALQICFIDLLRKQKERIEEDFYLD